MAGTACMLEKIVEQAFGTAVWEQVRLELALTSALEQEFSGKDAAIVLALLEDKIEGVFRSYVQSFDPFLREAIASHKMAWFEKNCLDIFRQCVDSRAFTGRPVAEPEASVALPPRGARRKSLHSDPTNNKLAAQVQPKGRVLDASLTAAQDKFKSALHGTRFILRAASKWADKHRKRKIEKCLAWSDKKLWGRVAHCEPGKDGIRDFGDQQYDWNKVGEWAESAARTLHAGTEQLSKSRDVFKTRKVKMMLDNTSAALEGIRRKKPKSKARVAAGKAKRDSISRWPEACQLARAQLTSKGVSVPSRPRKGTEYHAAALGVFKSLQHSR